MVLARGLHGGAVRDQLGLQPSDVPTVAGGPASQGLPHGAGKLVLRVGGRMQFLSIWTSPQGCLSGLMA